MQRPRSDSNGVSSRSPSKTGRPGRRAVVAPRSVGKWRMPFTTEEVVNGCGVGALSGGSGPPGVGPERRGWSLAGRSASVEEEAADDRVETGHLGDLDG